jgi:hypothetical protein
MCRRVVPPLADAAGGHVVACHAVAGPHQAEYSASAPLGATTSRAA